MLEVLTNILGLQVYTDRGVYVGMIANVVLDLNQKTAEGVFVSETNPNVVEGSVDITIPFRWIQSIGDIVVLKHFPGRIELSEREKTLFEREQAFSETPEAGE
jgi:sporulation protein YlmC with PRC-barrel domain